MRLIKILLIFLICLSVHLPSFGYDYINNLIKVGISDNNNLEHNEVEIASLGYFNIISDSKVITKVAPFQRVFIKRKNNSFIISHKLEFECINSNNIKIIPLNSKPIKLLSIKKAGKTAQYRGNFEIEAVDNNSFNLINNLNIEDYLKGVVPSEIPMYFGLEAVKAQSIAARNYTLRPVKKYKNFDVCDTVLSQVYYGINSEKQLANKAIEDTKGLFALYEGQTIITVYSSTAGGHTEGFENCFTTPNCNTFPSNPIAYLKGIYDLDAKLDLSVEENAKRFYKSRPESYDIDSKHYRWQVEWDSKELAGELKKSIKEQIKTGYIKQFDEYNFNEVKDVQVLKRGVSGKVITLKLTTDTGYWIIQKELVLRRTFTKNGKALKSANFVVEKTPTGFIFYGGGYGHGVGMSQYGAGYMSKKGFSFDDILQHYYTGITIGTYPVIVSNQEVTQVFNNLSKQAFLCITNLDNINSFSFKINGKDIECDITGKNSAKMEITPYLKEGENTIIYLPNDNAKMIKAWTEIFGKKK